MLDGYGQGLQSQSLSSHASFLWSFLSSVMVRAILPEILPPSYKGATLRYHYFIKSTLSGRFMASENSQFYEDPTKDFIEVVSLLDFPC